VRTARILSVRGDVGHSVELLVSSLLQWRLIDPQPLVLHSAASLVRVNVLSACALSSTSLAVLLH
jgi:hypothetical protein